MSNIKLLSGLLIVIILNGCATTAKYEQKLQYWLGKTEEELVSVWGVPTSNYTSESQKLLMYRQDFGATTTAQPVYGTYYMNTTQNWCETTFVIRLQKISSFQLKGNSCVSY